LRPALEPGADDISHAALVAKLCDDQVSMLTSEVELPVLAVVELEANRPFRSVAATVERATRGCPASSPP
jgi:hypothetical protein